MKYQTEQGTKCGPDNPDRMVFLSSCGMWTDEWDKLGKVKLQNMEGMGIPCCKRCEAVGSQSSFGSWQRYLETCQVDGYVDFLIKTKGTCPFTFGYNSFTEYFFYNSPAHGKLLSLHHSRQWIKQVVEQYGEGKTDREKQPLYSNLFDLRDELLGAKS